MLSNLSDATMLRIIISAVFLGIIIYILLSSRTRSRSASTPAVRIDPEIRSVPEEHADNVVGVMQPADETEFREQAKLHFETEPVARPSSRIGMRSTDAYEKLVMLYLAAKSGQSISGAELVLATEKVGLVYGHNSVYHRLAEGVHANEPIFSMANVIQPGNFNLDHIDTLQTPGVSFFMTLPGPVTAIQAWDSMLPIAERMAQLLDAVLLDSDRNALGRQRILHIKEELRAFDRDKERQIIKPVR
ncbi:cell division protein ZipA [Arenimonas sp.]|jgi:cell division protein ZipA|uniref:cell division protein ZipA n=1 Tax=Arenimonas sp. TaxID=1872635 RepID=UPI0037C06521